MDQPQLTAQDLRQDDDALRTEIAKKIRAHGGEPVEITLEPHGADAVVARVVLEGSDVEEQGVFLRSTLFPE